MTPPARHQAVMQARQIIERRPLILDTETTGLGSNAEIVEISVVDHDGVVLLDTLVQPRYPIPADATAIHGITNAMVRTAQGWDQVWPRLQAILNGRLVGIYNADYDTRLIRQSSRLAGIAVPPPDYRVFCIMLLFAQYHGEWDDYHGNYRWQKLDIACRRCGIAVSNAHRALTDALGAREVLRHMSRHA